MATYTMPEIPGVQSRPAGRREELLLVGGVLADVALSEALTVWIDRGLGLGLYGLLLLALLWQAAFTGEERTRRVSLALALVPLLRVIGLALPQAFLPAFANYAAVAAPLFIGVAVALRRTSAPATALGLTPGQGLTVFLWYPLLALTGVIFGLAQVAALGRLPALPALSTAGLAAALIVLALGVGLLEEVIFRGLILHAVTEVLGGWSAVIYVALLAAVLQLGTGSPAQAGLAFIMALWLGWATLRAGTLYPAALAHALAVVVAYLILPLSARL